MPSEDPKRNAADKERSRVIADEVVRRALADPSFREKLKSNPVDVLEEAGIKRGPAEDASREMQIDGVSTDLRCDDTCDYTCFFTCWYATD
jgi:hypothetical protein